MLTLYVLTISIGLILFAIFGLFFFPLGVQLTTLIGMLLFEIGLASLLYSIYKIMREPK